MQHLRKVWRKEILRFSGVVTAWSMSRRRYDSGVQFEDATPEESDTQSAAGEQVLED